MTNRSSPLAALQECKGTGGIVGGLRVVRLCQCATLPTERKLAEWWMHRKSLMNKVLVSLPIRLCHVATGPYSLSPSSPQRAPAHSKPAVGSSRVLCLCPKPQVAGNWGGGWAWLAPIMGPQKAL